MNVKNHRQIVEQHFNDCLKQEQLTFQEATTIASTSKNYDLRLARAISSFLSSNLYSVDVSTVADILSIGRDKATNFVNIS